MMDQALADLIRISRAVGGDRALVLGGGGNTSVKTADGQSMYIKASGTAIKDIDEHRGWRRLRVSQVVGITRDPAIARLDETAREMEICARLLLCCEDEMERQARPSVESPLHAMLGRCVVHLHPLVVLAYVCAKRGKTELAALFRTVRSGAPLRSGALRRVDEARPPLWVPYADPGYLLAVKAERLIREYRRRHGVCPSLLLLEKHGVFASAESAEAVLRLVRKVIRRCAGKLEPGRKARPFGYAQGRPRLPSLRLRSGQAEQEVTAAKLAVRKGFFDATGEYVSVAHFSDAETAGFLARSDAKALSSLPPLMPEEIVYANGSPMWLDRGGAGVIADGLRRQLERGEKPAHSFLLRRVGLIAAGQPRMLALTRDIAVTSLLTRASATQMGGPNPLTKRQREFIAKWEAESYRQVIAGGAAAGELAGRIAMVSGGGSGLGRSIAIGLAKEGALVGLADIDPAAAEQTANAMAREIPSASAVAIRCDVTDEAAVAEAYRQLLARWGGLDILVNAAGIAPPYALVDLPLDQWRAALEVNLTGYFLMAREAARIMIRQGMGGNIIVLSSKSGLEASRNNTPYNATKAGEIHMARGWALELGQHGIRVNALAPGNVFQGSKIWSPGYIRMCAKKCGIKPEEVIPYYVGMTALKRDITGQDVADAVVFLCSDKARTITGQTLVPDSGQVMVR
jgi:NAD(P)-dependent dehydrogenase (short-subunit alcohol dehydrogenase family)/rhamnose utilization protein RhaD (predicted bifunctional aldolase and dehydrogenase)